MAAGTGLAAITAPLALGSPAQAMQHLWRWCHQCSGLWFSGNSNSGYCPVGSGIFGWDHPHRSAGSGDYVLGEITDPGAGETEWKWCSRCAGLWTYTYGWRGVRSTCPNSRWLNGSHDSTGSGSYKLEGLPGMTNGPGGQNRWFLCAKCAGLFFAGNGPKGVCPAGGAHENRTGIGLEYVLRQL
ncbi:hypothetical protein [Streptomyces sp. NPDC090445]|uniref:hypothetical protein n=1 Tax=Streptomyces sp. NPDC090445 TaxID=3365963 RepID=UPI0038089FB7